jgi:hypothetical protein
LAKRAKRTRVIAPRRRDPSAHQRHAPIVEGDAFNLGPTQIDPDPHARILCRQ